MSRRSSTETPSNEPPAKQRRNLHREILLELLKDETACIEQVIKEKKIHPHQQEYDLFGLSYRDAEGQIISTLYVLCDHLECRPDLEKALYHGLKKTTCRIEKSVVQRHENNNHVKRSRMINFLALQAVVLHNLPLRHFELEGIVAYSKFLDPTLSQGIPSYQIKKNLDAVSAQSFAKTKKFSLQLLQSGRGSFLCDHYDHFGIKWIGIVIVEHKTFGNPNRRILCFRRAENTSDEATRQFFYETLTKYGLQNFYDERRIQICGDHPIKRAFATQLATACIAHVLSLICKGFVSKCKKLSTSFETKYDSTTKAVAAFCHKKKRPGCPKLSMNEEILAHKVTSPEEIEWIRKIRGKKNAKNLLVMETINSIRFRSIFNTFRRLQIAKLFIQGRESDYTDGHRVDWGLTSFMYEIGKSFVKFIDLSDSDRFSVTDALFTLFKLLDSLLAIVVDAEYLELQREMIFSTLDYIFGNRRMGRYTHGPPVEGRADDFSITAYCLCDFSARDFEFLITREKIVVARNNGVLTREDEKQITDILNESAVAWKMTVRKTAHDVLQRIAPPQTAAPESQQPQKETSCPTQPSSQPSQQSQSSSSTSSHSSQQTPRSQTSSASTSSSNSTQTTHDVSEDNAESSDDSDDENPMQEHYRRCLGTRQSTPNVELNVDEEIDRWSNLERDGYQRWLDTLTDDIKFDMLPGRRTELYFSNSAAFPQLAKLAKLCSSTPSSASGIERIFSSCTSMMSPDRSQLDDDTVEKMLQLRLDADIGACLKFCN